MARFRAIKLRCALLLSFAFDPAPPSDQLTDSGTPIPSQRRHQSTPPPIPAHLPLTGGPWTDFHHHQHTQVSLTQAHAQPHAPGSSRGEIGAGRGLTRVTSPAGQQRGCRGPVSTSPTGTPSGGYQIGAHVGNWRISGQHRRFLRSYVPGYGGRCSAIANVDMRMRSAVRTISVVRPVCNLFIRGSSASYEKCITSNYHPFEMLSAF